MVFHDIRFPIEISIGAEGGPVRRTQVVTLSSGHEERNSPWAASRRRFNAGYGVKSLSDIEQVIAFFEARQGRLHSFRWRDPFDWKSCILTASPDAQDQEIATGDGTTTAFNLIKTYASGAQNNQRIIRYPVDGTLLVAVDGVVQQVGTDYTWDDNSRQLVFSVAPAAGALITAGFEFDIPVRFDTDQLSVNMTDLKAGDIPSIPVIEVLS